MSEEEDEVWTDLFGGRRVTKDNVRVELCGDIDEANSALGLARATIKNGRVSEIVYKIQKELFIVGAECATLVRDLHKLPRRITEDDVRSLKKLYGEMKRSVAPLEGFVTPGHSFPSANLHLARTIIRRAERIAVRLRRAEKISKNVVDYLDVLSDLIFYLAVSEEESRKKSWQK